ncbi:MAG: sigma-70 family RNA polymerase sigma factor [Planctomycetota bacterium]
MAKSSASPSKEKDSEKSKSKDKPTDKNAIKAAERNSQRLARSLEKLADKSQKPDKSEKSDKSDKKKELDTARLAPPARFTENIPVVDECLDVASMSDEDLMKLCQEGDESAFTILFSRYETQALSFIHRLIGDQSRTEALGQEAFLRIFKDAKSYQYPRSFTTWFYTIVRNLCKNELRWRSRHPTVSIEENIGHSENSSSDRASRIGDMLRSESTDPLESMVLRERNSRLERAMDELPDLERDILILNRFQGLKYREISEIVGVPIGTVRVRIYSALETLRKSIKDYF